MSDKMNRFESLLETVLAPKRDYVPHSSPGSLKEFMESPIYTDFISEIKVRIEDMRDYYEGCPKDKYLETKGGLACLRLIAGIFTDLYENAITATESEGESDE